MKKLMTSLNKRSGSKYEPSYRHLISCDTHIPGLGADDVPGSAGDSPQANAARGVVRSHLFDLRAGVD